MSSDGKSGERRLYTRKLPEALGNGWGAVGRGRLPNHDSKTHKLSNHLCLMTVLNAFLELFPREIPAALGASEVTGSPTGSLWFHGSFFLRCL